jgi:glycosyltransferase involved in cell wall biosynthesis
LPITIGIPFYNAEVYLADAIRSIIAQTYQDWELILVDDGSVDRSLQIANSTKDPRIRIISDGQNRRLPYRLNQITAEAKYDLIGRMDADDMCSPFRFEKQIEILKKNPSIDLVSTGLCSISNDNLPQGFRCHSETKPITIRGLILGKFGILHPAILGRKSWFLRNPYDETMKRTEDRELWLRTFSNNDLKVYILPEALYYYREDVNGTASKILQSHRDHLRLMKKYCTFEFNRYEMALFTAKTYCKSQIVRVLEALDKIKYLIKIRNKCIKDESMLNHFVNEIEFIRKINLYEELRLPYIKNYPAGARLQNRSR